MLVKELREKLQNIDGDMEITCLVSNHSADNIGVHVRDFLHHETKEFRKKILVIGNMKEYGWPELTEEVYQEESFEFIDALYDDFRPRGSMYGGGRRFTTIHGDDRIYNDYGTNNDTCYGKAYDPRIIKRMLEEGLIEKVEHPSYGRGHYGIVLTEKGKKEHGNTNRSNPKRC